MSLIDRRFILQLVASAPLVLSPARLLAQRSDATRYGMIEIGSSGVKVNAYIFRREAVTEDEGTGPSGRERFAPGRVGKGYTVNTNPITGLEKDIIETARVAGEAIGRLTSEEFGVPRGNIAICASSGVAAFPAIIESLSSKVRATTGMTLDSVTPAEESQLSYDWIVYKHRRQQVLLVDIGSGNTKGGYYEQVGTPQQRFRDFSVPLGTKSFANAIRKDWPDDPVASRALPIFQKRYLPVLNDQIASQPGMLSRPRVYLSGGIFWATALLTRPTQMAQQGSWVRMRAQEFATLGKLIASGDPYSLARNTQLPPAQTEWLAKQLTAVAETFNPDQLAAGNALCQALSSRLEFPSRSAIFFAAFAVDAWSSQYLVRKFRAESLEA